MHRDATVDEPQIPYLHLNNISIMTALAKSSSHEKTALHKHLYIKRLQTALQKVAFYRAKGNLSACKRWPFGVQKMAFQDAFCALSGNSLKPVPQQAVIPHGLPHSTCRRIHSITTATM